MKKVLFTLFAILLTTPVMAFQVVTGKDTINAVVVEGKAYAIPISRICGMDTIKIGSARYDVGRDGKYVTIGGEITRITCVASAVGGGSSGQQSYRDEWKDSPLVDDDGNVTMNPGETKTDQPSTDPTDSGFNKDGPPSIDG